MDPGNYRDFCSLQAPAVGQDDAGQPLQVWAEVATFWADIRTTGGLESIKAGAPTEAVRYSIRTRYRTDPTNAMRVVCGEVIYEIEAVLPDKVGRKFLDLVCEVIT